MPDVFQLERFVEAQRDVYDDVLAELRAGQKQSHWMWFVFPQIKGLGNSPTAKQYAIRSRSEAVAYLEHPVLGSRLRECTQLVIETEDRTIGQIFGYPDDLKFRSSMTLFANVTLENELFVKALQKYFRGEMDEATLDRL
jgi:uncharacterized protein (DUF1810 family)